MNLLSLPTERQSSKSALAIRIDTILVINSYLHPTTMSYTYLLSFIANVT